MGQPMTTVGRYPGPVVRPAEPGAERRSSGVARTVARDMLLGPFAGLFIVARAAAARPALLAALAVVLVCVPLGNQDVTAAVHVTPSDVGSVLLVLAALPRVFADRRLARAALWGAMAAVVLALAVASIASADVGTSWSGFARYAQLFVVVPVAVVVAVREDRDLWLICGAVLAAAVIEGAYGAWQYLTGAGASFAGQDVRAVGTFGAQDVMGMSTVVSYGILVALGLAIVLRGRRRLLLLGLAALLVLPLLLSLSRGAVIATAAAVALMLLAAAPRLAMRTAVFGAAAAVVLYGALGGTATTVGDRLATITSVVNGPDRSVSDRYELWQTATAMWRDHPLTGVGIKMFPSYRDSYAPLHLSSGSDVADPSLAFERQPLLSPHNMYLLVLSEQGLIGAVAFGTLILGLFLLVWRGTRASADRLGPPDGRVPDGRLIGVVSVGTLGWTLVNFAFSDIGGQTTVLMSILIGLGMWWALRPVPEPDGVAR